MFSHSRRRTRWITPFEWDDDVQRFVPASLCIESSQPRSNIALQSATLGSARSDTRRSDERRIGAT